MDINLVLLFIIELILLAICFLTLRADILAPSVVLCVMFIISTLFCSFNVVNWNIDYSINSVFILSIGLFFFCFTEIIISIFCKEKKSRSMYSEQCLHECIVIDNAKSILTIIFGVALLLWLYSETMRIARIGGYSGVGNALTFYRSITTFSTALSKEEQLNSILNMLIKFIDISGMIYLYAIIYNRIWGFKVNNEVLYYFPVVIYIVKQLLCSNRGKIIMLIVYGFVIGYVFAQEKAKWTRRTSNKFIFRGAMLVLVGLPLFYYSASLIGRTSQLTHGFLSYISFYVGGAIEHFNQYIVSPSPENTVFGKETLVNIHNLFSKLGLSDTRSIVPLEFRYLNNITRGNVYTFFRRPYHDFGLFGMIVFTIIISSIFSWLYHKRIRNHYTNRINYRIFIYAYSFYLIAMGSIECYVFTYLSASFLGFLVLSAILIKFYTSHTFKIGKVRI